jgi:hypothetical protein
MIVQARPRCFGDADGSACLRSRAPVSTAAWMVLEGKGFRKNELGKRDSNQALPTDERERWGIKTLLIYRITRRE